MASCSYEVGNEKQVQERWSISLAVEDADITTGNSEETLGLKQQNTF